MQSHNSQPTLGGRAALVWIVAHVIGLAVLSIGSLFLLALMRDNPIGHYWTPSATFIYVLLGWLQGGLLRSFRIRLRLWFTASIVGGILAGFADAAMLSAFERAIHPLLMPFVRSAIAGVIVGICQWCVLRQQGEWASLWIVAMGLIGLLIELEQLSSIFVWCAGIGLIVPGALIGGITGAALATILYPMLRGERELLTTLR